MTLAWASLRLCAKGSLRGSTRSYRAREMPCIASMICADRLQRPTALNVLVKFGQRQIIAAIEDLVADAPRLAILPFPAAPVLVNTSSAATIMRLPSASTR